MSEERIAELPEEVICALEIQEKIKDARLPFSVALQIGAALTMTYVYELLFYENGTIKPIVFPGDFKSGSPNIASKE